MVASLVERLAAHGVDAEVSVLDRGGDVADGLLARGVPVHYLGGTASHLLAVWRLARLFRRRRFDVVHLYGFRMSLVGRAAATTVRNAPRLIHGIRGLHLGDWTDEGSVKTRLAIGIERLGSGLIDRYAANSPEAIGFLTARGLPREKFRLIPNGLDTTYWAPHGRPREPALLVVVANLRPVKRLPLLLDAVAMLAGEGRNVKVQIVGDGSLRSDLEARRDALGLHDVVTFAGALPRGAVRDLLQSATVSALTSNWEGMPVSLLEAMACECPVVGTDVPGIRDLIDDDHTGLLAASAPASLAEAVSRVLDDPGLARRLGQSARRAVTARYSLERMAVDHVELYTIVRNQP